MPRLMPSIQKLKHAISRNWCELNQRLLLWQQPGAERNPNVGDGTI
jgi:hypothetical protein